MAHLLQFRHGLSRHSARTITHKVTTAQKALTNAKFGRGADNQSLYLTSSDMERVTGYIYRAKVSVGGVQ